MRVLLSSIGSRGDVQPLIALGIELQALGQYARLVVPPNFQEWVESYGLECVPIGPDLKKLTGGTVPGKPVLPSKEQLQKMADESVRDQFRVLGEAARDCGLILGATALQFAAHSISEAQGIPYIFAAYCPVVFPSAEYPPTRTGGHYPFDLSGADNLSLWQENAESFNKFAPAINQERARLGLNPITAVRDYIFTSQPWLAADPVLAPAIPLPGSEIVQTGAWLLADPTPLPAELEQFLATGNPPVFLGFGSMKASDQTAETLVAAARALGVRAVLSQGWAGLLPGDAGDDILSIGEVNYEKLFPRVSAVVHHGGAGTSTTAARAGCPQLVIPHNYDQFYWAHRVEELGVGISGPTRDDLTPGNLIRALRLCLRPETAAHARDLSASILMDGARLAAHRLIRQVA